jgi:thiol-disulfide isomerase/thioredoxin
MRTLAIVLLACSTGLGQTGRYACEPVPEVAAAIRSLDELRNTIAPDYYLERARASMGEMVRKHPDDVFAQLLYLRFFHQKGHADIVARYRSAMEAHPGDPRYAMYYASSLIGTDTPEAVRRLTALAAAPDFPHPHLLLAEIYSYEKFKDNKALSASLIRFVRSCPGYLPAYELLSYLGAGDELGGAAAGLRQVPAGRTDREAAIAYRWLWPMEFRVTAPSEHGALRERVEQDMAFLRSKRPADDPVTVQTLRAGYRASGNTAAMNGLPPEPSRSEAIYVAGERWNEEHPFKDEPAYYRATAEAAQSWIARWPDEPMGYLRRFLALAKLPEATEAELVRAGDQLIAINRKRPTRFLSTPAVITVSGSYVDRGVRLNEIPAMIAAGLREADFKRFPEFDFFDDRNQRMNEESRLVARIHAFEVEFDWALKTSNPAKGQRALLAMRSELDQLLAVAMHQGRVPQILDGNYWKKMARLAEVEGRSDDAEKYKRTAGERRSVRTRSPGPSFVTSAVGTRLPALHVTGLDGRVWTAADLEGKRAIINVWATWCAPCVEELPYFQKLYDRLKDKSDVVVLTMNVDSNPGVVAPFLARRGLTFPILLAHDFVEGMLPNLGIPRNWVVEGGVIRSEITAMNDKERWLAEMLAKAGEK